jgi:hypothetical protein
LTGGAAAAGRQLSAWLLAGLERKNGWTLVEHAGAVSPDGDAAVAAHAGWDVDGVRDDVRGYVLQHLGGGASGVFMVEDTGFIKKGMRSAGVARQFGTAGKSIAASSGSFWPTPALVVTLWLSFRVIQAL